MRDGDLKLGVGRRHAVTQMLRRVEWLAPPYWTPPRGGGNRSARSYGHPHRNTVITDEDRHKTA